MATIFPREQKAKMLFEKIKENPQACERLMETFYDALGVGDDYEATVFLRSSSQPHCFVLMRKRI